MFDIPDKHIHSMTVYSIIHLHNNITEEFISLGIKGVEYIVIEVPKK